MAELREAFSKVGECSQQQRHCWRVNLWPALFSWSDWPAVRKWSCSSTDHTSPTESPFPATASLPEETTSAHCRAPASYTGGCWELHQDLQKTLKSCTVNHVGNLLKCFRKNTVYSQQIVWKTKRFYFNVKWAFPMGRKSVERTNMQMDKKFVIPSQWPLKLHISTLCFLSKLLDISSDFSPSRSHRPITVYPNSKKRTLCFSQPT